MIRWKKLLQYAFLFLLSYTVWNYDTMRKESEYKELRTESLVSETRGEIFKIVNKRYANVDDLVYSYFVSGKNYSRSYQMTMDMHGIQPGHPVLVVYLKEDLSKSRLVWTKDDFDWIE